MKNKIIKCTIIVFTTLILGIVLISNTNLIISKLKRNDRNTSNSPQSVVEDNSEQISQSVPNKDRESDRKLEDNSDEKIYDGISKSFMNMEGVEFMDVNETFEFEGMRYCFGTPVKYEYFQNDWDFDEKGDYNDCKNGYIEVPLQIEVSDDSITYLNGIGMYAFDEKFNYICGYETYTSDIHKSKEKSYFECHIKKGDTLSAKLVYADSEAVYDKAKYIVLLIDNHGGNTGKSEDYKFIKIKGF